MAELVGGALLSSFLNVLFDRLATREVVDFVGGEKTSNGRLLRKLKLKLLSVRLVVDDAEEKQIRNPEVRQWLDELKDTLYHAGDLLDAINTEALRRKLEADESGTSSSSHQVHSLNSTSFDKFDKALEPKILDIIDRLEFIVDQKDALSLKEVVKDRSQAIKTRETTSLLDDAGAAGVYGRDQDKKTIKKWLLSDDATNGKIGVIPIVGMAGMGKTTLAQLLYDDVGKEFDLQAWVCVSEEFDLLRVTQEIYGSITSTTCAITQLDQLHRQLKERLENKKFLLVLDDVWNENYTDWEVLKRPFNSGAVGSRIIVTTRSEGVSLVMRSLQSYNLKQISDEDCWLIFAKHALGSKADELSTQHPDLSQIGRQIATKCKGLPLSAKSLGGLLRSEVRLEIWKRVLESDIWELLEKDSDILPALWISYRYLPSHLKRCFAYCSIFPKDYQFSKSELVLMWMAEDLLQPEKKKMIEEVGEDYFNTLISRSFFQPSTEKKWEMTKEVSCFTMHDLINDLAKYVSGDFCLRLEDEDSLVDVGKTRHFSHMHRMDGSKKFEALYKAKSLHTFESFGVGWGSTYILPMAVHDLLVTWQCLRLLNLSRYDVSELPSSIGNLKHLRHLDLSATEIKELPDTLCTLYNMQTLLLRRCRHLVRLPTNLRRLVNLRHLDISYTSIKKMPPYMGGMKDLQLLSDFGVGKDVGDSGAELKELQHLGGTLCISGLENIVSDKEALEADTRGKKNLNKLVLQWSEGVTESSEKDRQVLEQLQPHTNLKELEIVSYGGTKFPSWVGDHSFNNLVFVKLVKCEFCFSLPPLGQLRSLKKLRIEGLNGVVSIGSEFYGNSTGGVQPFRSLKSLEIEDMLEWQEWVYVGGDQEEESAIFPNLHLLQLSNCPKLTNTFPLDKIQNLEEVVLSDLSCLKSFAGTLSQESECPKFLSLTKLSIWHCPEFVRFSDGGGIDAPKLEDCDKLGSLPERMHTLLPSLTELQIRNCPELESFPEGGLPPALKSLVLVGNEKLFANRKQWGLQALKSLEEFIIGCGESEEVGSSFPEEGLLPANLTQLILHWIPNLTSIDGKQLRLLNSLQKLEIVYCPKLECLPEEGLPTSLKELRISRCPLLEERCERGNGQDWPKIAHIPYIRLNYRQI